MSYTKEIRKSYRFRIYPTPEQKKQIRVNFNDTRFVYNHFFLLREKIYNQRKGIEALETTELSGQRINELIDENLADFEEIAELRPDKMGTRLYKVKEDNADAYTAFWAWQKANGLLPKEKPSSPSAYTMSKMLTKLKNELVDENGKKWLYDADSSALVQEVHNLDKAYKRFFDNVKKGRKVSSSNGKESHNPYGHPVFHSRNKERRSYTIQIKAAAESKTIDYEQGTVKLGKLGKCKCVFHREVEAGLLFATVSRESDGKYYVSFTTRPQNHEVGDSGKGRVVAVELGLRHYAVTSDGEVFEKPRHYRELKDALAKEQRKLSCKTGSLKGERKSNAYKRQQKRVGRVYRKIVHARENTLHDITRKLVNEYDTIIIRELEVKKMMDNEDSEKRESPRWHEKELHQSLSDASFSTFKSQIMYKADWEDKRVVVVPSDFPSTQLCSICGYKNEKLAGEQGLKYSEWTCPQCGAQHDREINSAANLLNKGLEIMREEEVKLAQLAEEAKVS